MVMNMEKEMVWREWDVTGLSEEELCLMFGAEGYRKLGGGKYLVGFPKKE
jgi:hypothetical protein